MKRRTAGKVAVSYRSLGKTFGLSPTTVKKYLDSQDINLRCRQKCPKVSDGQNQRQTRALWKLARSEFRASSKTEVIMDDETYFVSACNEWTGKFYYTNPKGEVTDQVKFIESEKYPNKLMVWLAIGRKGASKPVFFC